MTTQRLAIQTLGGLTLRLGEQPLPPFHSRKAEALLVYLACTRQAHAREVLADMFWDERSQTRAATNLRTLLASMRPTLAPYLLITRYAVGLDPQSDYQLDSRVFEQDSERLDPPDIARLESAVALYRGDFLQGFYIRESPRFEEWMLMQQERLQRRLIVALHALIQHYLTQGEYKRGIEWASQLLRRDALDEHAHQQMMKLLALSGQLSAALSQYQSLQRLMQTQLGVAPSAETTVLVEQIRAGQWTVQPAAPTAAPPSIALRPSSKLVGRGAQLAALSDLVAQAASGQGRMVSIAGEAGIGKSRLVSEVKSMAGRRDLCVLQGYCFEQDRAYPFAPLIDLLRSFCMGRSAEELGRAFESTAPELMKLSPELSTLLPHVSPAPAIDPDGEKRRLFQALAQFVARAANESLVLLIIEDLHWCDDTSLDWLLYLARHSESQRVLALLTYRDDEVSPTLNRVLAALDHMPFVSEMKLAHLSRAEVDALLRTSLNLAGPTRVELLDALYTLTDGNPFFIEEVLKSLITAGDLYQDRGEWARKPSSELRIPRSIQVAVQQRTRQLSEAAQHLLTLAAVAGQRFDFNVLQAAAQASESELLLRIKELLAAQLVIEETDETFAFRHALTRQAIETGLLARERKALHRTIAEAMERCYADVLSAAAASVHSSQASHLGELAYHFYEAGDWARSLAWAQRAGERAEQLYAYAEALSHYLRARECAERLGRPDSILALDQIIGRVHYARNDGPQALIYLGRALAATTDPARRAALKAAMGATYASNADERGYAFLSEALAELDPATQPRDVATASLWLGRHYSYRGHFAESLPYLERARELSEELGDTTAQRFVYGFLADALLWTAQFEQAMSWARRSVALGEAKQYLPAVIVGYYDLSTNAGYMGRWQDAKDFAARGRELTRQSGWLTEQMWIELRYARAAFHTDHLMTGVQLARGGLALATDFRGSRSLHRAYETIAVYETALGNEQAAYQAAEAALREAEAMSDVAARCRGRLALAGVYAQREEWTLATELYAQCAALVTDTEYRVMQLELGAPMAEAYCAQGRLDEARQLLASTLTEAQAAGARPIEAATWRVRGKVEAASGMRERAQAAFDASIALYATMGGRLEWANALYQRGSFLIQYHEVELGRADWESARGLCEQVGGAALLWRVHAALGRLALDLHQNAEAEREFRSAHSLVAQLAAAMNAPAFREHLLRRAAELVGDSPLASR